MLPYEYSSIGQVEKEYLPYTKEGNNGAFDANMLVPSHWSIYGTEEQNYAFTHTQYENSPLARVVQQTGPGKAWHTNGKGTNIDYDMNHSEEVRLYKVSSNGVLSVGGYYQSGTLQKQIVTDEDGHKSEIFTDNNDKTILTIAVDGNEKMETYYVYDARNQLRYVLPPEATHQLGMSIDISVLEKLAYYYEYDRKGRMTVKRLPGCQLISMVYDRCDRLILSQNGKQCTENTAKWSYFIYDNQNRIIEDGEIILSFSPTHEQLQQEAWDKESYLPEGVRAPLQYTTYDNYEVSDKVTAHPFVSFSGYHDHYNLHVSGLKTRTKVKILGTDDWLTTTFYYDDHSRSIQLICDNPQGILSYINTVYDFIGNTLKKQEVYDVDTLETTYEYDDRGRLLVKNNIWNGKALDRINYEYDALGQLKSKHCGEHIIESLSYNIRGWITDIQCSSFSQTLHYTDGSGIPCYNGNISSMTWHSGSEAGLRGYKFTYDGFSRLKDAVYGEGELLSNNTNHFNEQVTGYDKNGNILGLLRYGQTNTMSYDLIDNLNLVYNGNQLESVNDNATGHVFGNGMEFKDGASREIEYEYDANGNLTKDLNKKIADIQYNCLNLPEKVQFEGGNSISYLYAADGTKLRTTYKAGNATIITDYCGNAIYENGVLVKVLTGDGYITASDNQFHYFIQDHQGNNRVVVAQNGTVEEVNDYYPFGGLLSSSLSNNVQPYKYNGKELNRDNVLDWYDYGARMYDASLGRWHAVDPSGEKYPALGLYAYCKNSPIIRIDPDGKDDYVVNANEVVYLMRKTDRIVDVLYASGINSSQKATQPDPNWKSIRVFDKSMLQGLTENKGEDWMDRLLYTTTNSVYNASNVFLFVAGNTNVEWTLKGGYKDGRRTFVLGTNNNENQVSSINGLINTKDPFFLTFKPMIDIHSHPYNPFASLRDMDNARLLRDIRYSIYYENNIINYTDQNDNTYSISVNSMNDLMRYIFQQLR